MYIKIKDTLKFILAEAMSLVICFLFSPFFLIGLLVYGVLAGQIGGG